MIQDLHSHTYYSFCGKDSPEKTVEAAIAGGIELFGISDHSHGVGYCRVDAFFAPEEAIAHKYANHSLERYFDHMTLIKEKYKGKIEIMRGIEIAAHTNIPKVDIPSDADVSFFDYCLVENPDLENTIIDDLFAFRDRCGCPHVGIAHTDMFGYIKSRKEDPFKYFKRMAEENMFWEMNVSFDSIHKYHEHPYMLEFFKNEEQQAIVRESGIRLSVGFDGHRVEDYLPTRVKEFCHRITNIGIKLAFEK
ncbi:MAG: PHP domain-containing protein [Clostridia bacterium]|nr:PHP domain-containing protein [Clostridia bacterium]